MTLTLDHVGLGVRDLESASLYWADATGFAVGPHRRRPEHEALAVQLGIDPDTLEVVRVQAANGAVELVDLGPGPFPDNLAVNQPGITHVCVQTAFGSGTYERFVAAGGRPHHPPVLLRTGIYYAYIRDAEHNVCELEQLGADHLGRVRQHIGELPGTWLGHVGIATVDIDRLTAFYSEALSGEPFARLRLGPLAEMDRIAGLDGVEVHWSSWLTDRSFGVELWQFDSPALEAEDDRRAAGRPGLSHMAYVVDDLDGEMERLSAAGASFEGAPSTCGDSVAVAFGRDPDGNLMELIQYDHGDRA